MTTITRRGTLAVAFSLPVLAACGGDDSGGDDTNAARETPSQTPSETPGETPSQTPGQTPAPVPTPVPVPASAGAAWVVVWVGAVLLAGRVAGPPAVATACILRATYLAPERDAWAMTGLDDRSQIALG